MEERFERVYGRPPPRSDEIRERVAQHMAEQPAAPVMLLVQIPHRRFVELFANKRAIGFHDLPPTSPTATREELAQALWEHVVADVNLGTHDTERMLWGERETTAGTADHLHAALHDYLFNVTRYPLLADTIFAADETGGYHGYWLLLEAAVVKLRELKTVVAALTKRDRALRAAVKNAKERESEVGAAEARKAVREEEREEAAQRGFYLDRFPGWIRRAATDNARAQYYKSLVAAFQV